MRLDRARLLKCAAGGGAAALTMLALVQGTASAGSASPDPGALTLAVYGDAPYGTNPTDTSETDATPAFIANVNADPDVTGVIHVGDIHSGSQYCTEAYDRQVFGLWQSFQDPLVYTPGDNEWTDCHKKKEGGGTWNSTTQSVDYVLGTDGQPVDYAGGNPVANLDLVRSIFFSQPGRTLGQRSMPVLSQAQIADPDHPGDAAYVENVMWERRGIVFVTVNIPGGSNDDTDVWYGAPSPTDEQTSERAARDGADLRWLDRAFGVAAADGARGVVVAEQADMWDLDGKAVSHIANYDPFVRSLATHTAAFGGPVLLLNGDSHTFRSDDPLSGTAPCVADGVSSADCSEWANHTAADGSGFDVANFHRITVHGSTFPLEWLKLTISDNGHVPSGENSFAPFSWQRMTQ